MRHFSQYYLRHTATAILMAVLFSSCNPDENLPEVLEKWKNYTTAHGLPSNFIITIHEDVEGRYWIGTANGLAVYEDNSFTVYTTNDGLLDNYINAIASDLEGNIWIGNEGGVNLYYQGEWFDINYMKGAATTSIVTDQFGNVWMGTFGYGVVKYDWDLQEFQQSVDNICDDCNYLNAIHEDKDGTLWFGTFADLKKFSNNSWQSFTLGDGLPGIIITAISSDGWGNVWIGSFDGTTVSRFTNGSFNTVEIGNGTSQNWIRSIQEDKEGTIWFATVANGLLTYNGVSFTRVNEGLPANTFTSLLNDSKGNLLIGTFDDGLIYYPIK